MDLQKSVLEQYMNLNDRPSFKKISIDTGIQVTRIFRIFNGSKMKLSEFEVFQQKVKCKLGNNNSLENLAHQCFLKLSQESKNEIEQLLKRKLFLWELKNNAASTQCSKSQPANLYL